MGVKAWLVITLVPSKNIITKTICLIKESTYDTTRIHDIVRLCGDAMTVIVAGGTTPLESLVVGAKAWMTGLNDIIPACYAHVQTGDCRE
jgi:4-hydroxy-tetrahydrodipicolinate synthase